MSEGVEIVVYHTRGLSSYPGQTIQELRTFTELLPHTLASTETEHIEFFNVP